MSQYFPELFERSGGNVKFELDLSNYATNYDLKWVAGISTKDFAKKTDWDESR